MAFNLLITDDETGEVIHDLPGCRAIVAGVVDEEVIHRVVLTECTTLDLARAVIITERAIKKAEEGVPGIKRAKRNVRRYEINNNTDNEEE